MKKPFYNNLEREFIKEDNSFFASHAKLTIAFNKVKNFVLFVVMSLLLILALTGCTAEEMAVEPCECQVVVETWILGVYQFKELESENYVPCFEPYEVEIDNDYIHLKRCYDGSTDGE